MTENHCASRKARLLKMYDRAAREIRRLAVSRYDPALIDAVTECGACKFYQADGCLEFARYLCLLDFPMSEAFGLGMARTDTIAEGGEKCDYRFKQGRKTPSGWPPEFLKGAKP